MKKRGLRVLLAAVAVMLAATSAAGAAKDSRKTKVRKDVTSKAWAKIDGVCYNGSGVAIKDAITRGIDVSAWQSPIDWQKAAKDVDFVFFRVADGSMLDARFDSYISGANEAGIPAGAYIFSRATTKQQALEEAQLVIKKVQGHKISYPIVYDLEAGQISYLSAKKISEMATIFCEEVKKAGYYPMVYCNVICTRMCWMICTICSNIPAGLPITEIGSWHRTAKSSTTRSGRPPMETAAMDCVLPRA